MFVDEIQEIKFLYSQIGELILYRLHCQDSSDYIKIKDNFNIVLDNLVALSNTLDIKNGTELITLCFFLIHNGFLSEKVNDYEYCSIKPDIISHKDDEILMCATNIFSGSGCCRNTATFAKTMLDKFNIINNLVETNSTVNILEKEKLLYFNNKHNKRKNNADHLINYINDDNIEYIVDITAPKMLFYNAYNQFAYPFFADLSGDKTLAYPLFNYGYFYKEMNYDQIRTLTLEEQSEISYRVDKAVELFIKNRDLFVDFYFQNERYYHKINSSYNRICEKEKRLGLRLM